MKALWTSSQVIAMGLLLLSLLPIGAGAVAAMEGRPIPGLIVGVLPVTVLWAMSFNVTARARVDIEILERLRRLEGTRR